MESGNYDVAAKLAENLKYGLIPGEPAARSSSVYAGTSGANI